MEVKCTCNKHFSASITPALETRPVSTSSSIAVSQDPVKEETIVSFAEEEGILNEDLNMSDEETPSTPAPSQWPLPDPDEGGFYFVTVLFYFVLVCTGGHWCCGREPHVAYTHTYGRRLFECLAFTRFPSPYPSP